MKRVLMLCMALFACAVSLTGCGVVEEGNVGVRRAWDGKIDPSPITGFYWSFTSTVTEYTTKETSVNLAHLTPQGLDKMTVQNLDATVFYQATPNLLPSFQRTFAGQSAQVSGDDFVRPGFIMVDNIARSAVMDEVAKFKAEELNTNRTKLESGIKAQLQARLNDKAPGVFTVTGVVVRDIQNDQSVQQSIRDNVAAANRLETAKKLVEVKQQEALANKELAQTLTPEFLQHEYNLAVTACAESGKCTLIIDGSNSGKVLNLPK